MTNVKLRVVQEIPIYKQYKTKPAKLLKIEHRDEVKEFMSHDTDQAHLYANRFIDMCHLQRKKDPNYDFDIEWLGVESF